MVARWRFESEKGIKGPVLKQGKPQLIIRAKTVLEFCFDSLLGCCEIGRLSEQTKVDVCCCCCLCFHGDSNFIPKGNSSNPVIPILLAGLL